jgi:hypothetical protein
MQATQATATEAPMPERPPLARADTGGMELWGSVDQLIDKAPGIEALTAHRLQLLAADRWGRIGRPISEELLGERRGGALMAILVGIVLQQVREICDGPILLIKGPDAAAYYPDPALRPFRDLDLLVPDPQRVQDALLRAGFELTGDERLYTGIHHLRPVVLPKLPVLIELHKRPKWVDGQPGPSVAELFEAAVPSATGVEGISTLPPAHHAVLLAVHAWAHVPLRRILDLVDVAAAGQVADEADARALAEAWGVNRLWRTTERAIDALFYLGRTPMPLRTWARNLRSARERTVLEAHLERTFSSFWALTPRRAVARMAAETWQHFRREPGESSRAKVTRSIRALRSPFSTVADHDRAVEARGLQAPSKRG